MPRQIDPELERRQRLRMEQRELERQEREARRERDRLAQLRKEEQRRLARGPIDMPFLLLVILLNAIGLIMLLSASFPSAYYESGAPFSYAAKQGFFACIGAMGIAFVANVDYHRLRGLSKLGLFISILLLFLVLIPGIGISHNNATRWLGAPGGMFEFQPSEIAKLAMVLYFADSIAQKKERMRTIYHGIVSHVFWLGWYIGLLFFEPHFSGMVLIAGTGGLMMLVGGIGWGWFFSAAGLAGAGAYVFINVIGYNITRIAMWHDPWQDAQDAGYQMVQSLLAIGSGGLLGVGLGKSRQKFLYLPEEHNDFIFAIICEELGFIGACIIILLFMALILRGYWIAIHARDRFGSLLVVGVITLIALQTFMNIAVVTGFIPATGISLPFFSYGGTALLIQLGSMGIVLSVSRQMKITKLG